MKTNLSFYLALVVLVAMSACTGGKKAESTESEVSDAPEVSYVVDAAASVVSWSGEVAGVYGHNGVIDIAEGTITATDSVITGGTVVIDMTTIQPLDSASYSEEHPASDLVGHLSTGDFFLVDSFPNSSFTIKKQVGMELIGDLTVRGTTKEETATLTSLEITPEGVVASADLVFDRQDYKVSWVHYMKDMVLSDDITIKIDLVAKP